MMLTPFLIRLCSFITIGLGVIVGTFFIDQYTHYGIAMIFFSVVCGMILLSLAMILQRLQDEGEIDKAKEQKEKKEDQNKEKPTPTVEVEKDNSQNQEMEDRKQLVEYYRQTEQQEVSEILSTPMKNIYVIKVDDYIDVVEINRFSPKLFNEQDVEKRPQLKKWIEKNIFN